MRVLRHFENFEQKASQLRSVIEDLMRRKLILEADIVAFETFEQIDPAMPDYPIAAQLVKDRRDNLCRTIKILDGKLSELQIRKQLQKVVDVIKVMDFSGRDYVERDLLLVKVAADESNRSNVFEIVNVFRGKVVDISQNDLIVELAGPEQKIQAFLDLMKPFDIREVVRSGRIAMARGRK